MRSAPALLLALGTVASAQQQVPLVDQVKGWYARASSAVSSFGAAASASASAAIPNPVTAAASAVAASQVHTLTVDNHREVLTPGAATASPGIEEWMVFVTGGNKTCRGFCGPSDREWNKSVPLLSASKGSPHLARLDCEDQPVLCHAWAVSPPNIVYIRFPQAQLDQSQAPVEVRYIHLPTTTVNAADIAGLYTKDQYKETPPYEGFWHPFDSPLARFGLNIGIGYLIWGFGKVPSWMIMVGISMFSRTFIAQRFAPPNTYEQTQRRRQQQAQAQGGAPARPAAS